MRAIALMASLLTVVVQAAEVPNNIIFVVGDGMGPAYTTAYRYFADDKKTDQIETTVFDRLHVGSQSTYPARKSGYITDSAAGATAFSCGLKTYNGAIAVDVNKQPCLTVMEWAKQEGMKTGLAVTSQIVHATPAAFVAHNGSRKNYNQIADSFFSNRVNGKFIADLMLGGGTDYFIRDDRNLVEEFKQAGFQYVDDLAQLTRLNLQKPALGLFAPVGMPSALDRQAQPGLLEMVKAAVQYLKTDSPKGYFLLIEASQIDWSGHANDIAGAMAEMTELDRVLTWLETHMQDDTLLVVTADHSTGGLSVGAKNQYVWWPAMLHDVKASPMAAAKALQSGQVKLEQLSDFIGIKFKKRELKAIQAEIGKDDRALAGAIINIINHKTNTGWTTLGHTGVDVPVMASGPGSEHFHGHLNNTDIGKILFKLLGK